MVELRCMFAVALFGVGACEVTGSVGGAAVASSESSSDAPGIDELDTSTTTVPDRPTGDDTDASSAAESSTASSDADTREPTSDDAAAASSESSSSGSVGTDEPSDSSSDETASDIGELAASCCSTGEAPGCPDDDVEACVCAQDPYCCDTAWDEVCVNTASYGGCGDPCGARLPVAPGECCEENFLGGSGCVDPYVQDCVCASDPYCCTQEWDDLCVGYIDEYGCGYCG
jgi:hypothetical protein